MSSQYKDALDFKRIRETDTRKTMPKAEITVQQSELNGLTTRRRCKFDIFFDFGKEILFQKRLYFILHRIHKTEMKEELDV